VWEILTNFREASKNSRQKHEIWSAFSLVGGGEANRNEGFERISPF
jgi:hypothetical protein